MPFKAPFRPFAKNPATTLLIVATLALGIGANTAIFTVANSVLLRPLPYSQPERLMLVSGADFNGDGSWGRISLPLYTAIREQSREFDGLAACIQETFNLSGHGDPEQVHAVRATWNLFDVLGVRPVAGRSFSQDEDHAGAANVVMLSHELATRLFNTPAAAIGRSITLDTTAHTVVGVLPANFTFTVFGLKPHIWAPRVFEMSLITPARVAAGGVYFNTLGRLRPGATPAAAQTEVRSIYSRYRQDKPGNYDSTLNFKMRVAELSSVLFAALRPTLLLLSAAVLLVLLIACANVASLLLSRSLTRTREFAMRSALGAGRATLMRQLLAESISVALVAAVAGVGLAIAGSRALRSLDHARLDSADLSVDLSVLGFTLVAALLSGVLFGLAPALQLSKSDLTTALRDGRASTGTRGRHRLRSALVAGQVALSMVLLICSVLLIRSFTELRATPPGFSASHVLTMDIQLPPARYPRPSDKIAFYAGLLRRVEVLPGVDHAALSTALPVAATHFTPALFEGQPEVPLGQRPIVNLLQSSPDYSRVMRIPLTAGRLFTEHDDAGAPKVLLVNQLAVKKFWPAGNPLGKRVWLGNIREPFEVIGVLADTRNNGLSAPTMPELLLPLPQMTAPNLSLSVLTPVDPHSLASSVRGAIAALDADQPVTNIRTMDEVIDSLNAQPRFTMQLAGALAGVAFILAVTGLYGVIAYSVTQRTRELGVRIALGADYTSILRLVVGQGLTIASVGMAVGIVASLAFTRWLSGMLYRVSPRDPLTFTVCLALFLVVAALASYVPARRAARVDPVESLRAE